MATANHIRETRPARPHDGLADFRDASFDEAMAAIDDIIDGLMTRQVAPPPAADDDGLADWARVGQPPRPRAKLLEADDMVSPNQVVMAEDAPIIEVATEPGPVPDDLDSILTDNDFVIVSTLDGIVVIGADGIEMADAPNGLPLDLRLDLGDIIDLTDEAVIIEEATEADDDQVIELSEADIIEAVDISRTLAETQPMPIPYSLLAESMPRLAAGADLNDTVPVPALNIAMADTQPLPVLDLEPAERS